MFLCRNAMLIQKHVVSVVTPKRDTLYLYDDQVGQCIADFWYNPTTKGEKPVIVLTNNNH